MKRQNKEKKTLAIIQARMSSTRLPGKVLMKVAGRPLLDYMVERIKQSKYIDQVIIATTISLKDEPIVKWCRENSIAFFRGSEEDVLARYYHTACEFDGFLIMRVTSDCPLMDPRVIDRTIDSFFNNPEVDYASSTTPLPCLYPDGMDVDVFSMELLEKTHLEAQLPSEREHVTFYMWKTGKFKAYRIDPDQDLSKYRFCVDYPQDFAVIEEILTKLYPKNPTFSMYDLIEFMEQNPHLLELQKGIERNAGWQKAFDKDHQYMEKKTMIYPKQSLNLQEKGKKIIPGLTQLLSKRPDQFAPGVWPGYFDRAKGVEVWDLEGNRYIDASISGIGAVILGYCDPDVDRAVSQVVAKGNFSSLNCPEEIELGELLCEIHPWADMVRYGRGGGEVMAIAVRIARAYTGRDIIAFCGYHGWHDWYLAANLKSDKSLEGHLLPGLKPRGVPRGLLGTALGFHYNKIEELEKIVADTKGKLAAIAMEPIRNQQPEPGFLEAVRKLADKTGAVLIFDEVSAGFRMNSGGSHLLLGVEPDMAAFAKAISNGYPMGAVIGKKNIMNAVQDTFISSTYWTDRIGPAAAMATIN